MISFKLASDVGGATKGIGRKCLRLLAAKTDAEALEKNKRLLTETVAMVGFLAIGGMAQMEMLKKARVGADEEDYLAPLRALKGAEDAVRFWSQRRFGPSVDVATMAASLLRLAKEAGSVTKLHLKIPRRWPHFRDLCEALDDNGDDVTKPVELANFIQDALTVEETVNDFIAIVEQVSPGPQKESRRSLSAVLRPVSMGGDLAKHYTRYEEGTRGFFFKDVDKWASSRAPSKRRAFWIKGTGGLGKSVIAAQVVKRGEDPGAACWVAAHFFCKHDDGARNSPRRAVGTLAAQLAQRLPEMAAALMKQAPERLAALIEGSEGSVDDCWEEVLAKPLREALQEWPADKHVVIVVDALDELRKVPHRCRLVVNRECAPLIAL